MTLKSRILSLGALICLSLGQSSAFCEGGVGGGGGDVIVAQFVSAANQILATVSFKPEHRQAILDGLRAKMGTVDILICPPDLGAACPAGTPVPNPKHVIAESWKGVVQLKNTPVPDQADVDSWEKMIKAGAPLAHQVIHELIRASGALDIDGNSIDEGYRLTIGQYGLDKMGSGILQKTFVGQTINLRSLVDMKSESGARIGYLFPNQYVLVLAETSTQLKVDTAEDIEVGSTGGWIPKVSKDGATFEVAPNPAELTLEMAETVQSLQAQLNPKLKRQGPGCMEKMIESKGVCAVCWGSRYDNYFVTVNGTISVDAKNTLEEAEGDLAQKLNSGECYGTRHGRK